MEFLICMAQQNYDLKKQIEAVDPWGEVPHPTSTEGEL
jgi:hypothetical protein